MATFRATINHIKAGGSESMQSLVGGGRASHAPPPRKRPERLGIELKCIFIDQFFKASSLKKIRLVTFIIWALGKAEKKAKKR